MTELECCVTTNHSDGLQPRPDIQQAVSVRRSHQARLQCLKNNKKHNNHQDITARISSS